MIKKRGRGKKKEKGGNSGKKRGKRWKTEGNIEPKRPDASNETKQGGRK